ncbi:glycosyltransferase family 4 protein [Cohnella caldifontis]|uniref:glycosyltransferase family 4 protein n=1 Tax=Cohnella caldifontis TaxID=3027471 RepID=UPI0023ED8D74|nr:glycosyltransferase family 4 protein [Cohnella sp. YIM B05605]
MRIAIVAPERNPVPPVLGGSVEIAIWAVAKELAKRHSVTVYSRRTRRYPAASFDSGVEFVRVSTGSPRTYLENVMREMAGNPFDVVQIDNRPNFVAPIKAQHPLAVVSLFLHSLTYVTPPYGGDSETLAGIDAADLVLVNSHSLHFRLQERFPFASGKIRTVWLGVDTDRFRPAERKKTGRAMTLLFAGRLIPRKGLPVLLKAVKFARAESPRPLHLVIAGGALKKGYSRKLRGLARSLGIRATFLGTVPHRRIHRIYRNADVFVCPSQKHEAFGLVNVEAMSTGLPVIASEIGGIREIVAHDRSGLLVSDYRSPRAFAEAILRLAREPLLLGAMKQEARLDCLNRFSWSATAERLDQIYASPFSPEED